MLIILDGWGIATNPDVSAIDKAQTPFVDSLYNKYPHSKLNASGRAVGLPEGQMGNSEVGHMNIGAGRIVNQDLVRISDAVRNGMLGTNTAILDSIAYAQKNNRAIHLIGLVSDGGIHSHVQHLKGLIDVMASKHVEKVFLHAFTDGRDTDPKSGKDFIQDLETYLAANTGKLASVCGRYYAMDRDKRWERIKLAYDLLVKGKGHPAQKATDAIQSSYDEGITDEFIKPIVMTSANGQPVAIIEPDDVVISFNFRTDRGRQIAQVLTQENLPAQGMTTIPLYYVTMTRYDEAFKNIRVLFEKDNLNNTLGATLEKAGKKQVRIAETEKYPHVTFFFSGGREAPFEGETRIMCPSPKVATYDLQPEMSAQNIRDRIIPELKNQSADFICLNFANPDMVGHTGIFEAAVRACETVDSCAKDVVEAGLENGYTSIIVADHGNSDMMINPDGTPNTAHTTNLVPCILVDSTISGSIEDGKLGDLAPTILKLMGIEKPEEMTGNVLI